MPGSGAGYDAPIIFPRGVARWLRAGRGEAVDGAANAWHPLGGTVPMAAVEATS